jgi:DNA-binding NtrC family response regulator
MEFIRNHNPRVLIVDDETIIADTLVAILARAGFDTRSAYSGEMAIEMARNFHPDLMITDVAMPGINGVEAAIKVREMLPTCKVLLFSGHGVSRHLVEWARAHDHHFELLVKPVHPEMLIAKVQSVMAD